MARSKMNVINIIGMSGLLSCSKAGVQNTLTQIRVSESGLMNDMQQNLISFYFNYICSSTFAPFSYFLEYEHLSDLHVGILNPDVFNIQQTQNNWARNSSTYGGDSSCTEMLTTAMKTTSNVSKNQLCAPAALAEQQVVSVEAPAPAVQTLTPAVPISVSLPQAQAAMPITVQGCPQV